VAQPKIAIILGSTRRGRFGERPARWLHERAASRGDAAFSLLDLRDFALPFFESDKPPAAAAPDHPEARRWAALLGAQDGFVFVTPEYNHGIPGVLKNAIDHAYTEWNRKPAGFLAYGGVGGARAVQVLRLFLIELQMAPLRNAVHIGRPEFGELRGGKNFEDFPALGQAADRLLDDVLWWARALKAARAAQ
jgi:NAD(P)H-dependent FMN reductase